MSALSFLAVIPDGAQFDASSFLAVCSPNPEDAAQFAIQQLSENHAITLVSFGPTTVTSHSYLVGQRSVLDSLLHSFLEADREVKLVIENSQSRYPKGRSTFYGIRSDPDVDSIYQKISDFPPLDYIKTTLVIEPYMIILFSLPSFVPFKQTKKAKFEANGWKVLLKPNGFLSTKSFVFLHFDLKLANETSVMKFLVLEKKEIPVSDKILELMDEVASDEPISIRSRPPIIIEEEEDESLPENSESGENPNPESPGSVKSARSHTSAKSVASNRSKRSTKSERIASNRAPSVKSESNVSIGSKKSTSVRSEHLFPAKDPVVDDPPSSSSRRKRRQHAEEDANDDLPSSSSRRKRRQMAEEEATDEPPSSRSGRRKRKQQAEEEAIDEPPSSSGRSGRRKRRQHAEEETIEPEPEIASESDSQSDLEQTEETIQFDQEEEDSPEMQIHGFVAQLQLNIPAFTNPSIYSTLIQQLFYERWKSVVLSKARSVLSTLRDRLKRTSTEEIQNLRELISAGNLSIIVRREEEKLRLLEKLSVEALEKVLESRCTAFSTVSTQGLLRSFRIICGDHVMLQRAVREKRAEIRGQVIELRIAQSQRLEKMQTYHQRVAELESAANAQTKRREAVEKLEALQRELCDAEADKQALLRQRDKVRAKLEAKKAEKQAAIAARKK